MGGAGPAESLIYGARTGDVLDSEQVCWPTKGAYMYVYNGCTKPINITLTVSGCTPLPKSLLLAKNPPTGSCLGARKRHRMRRENGGVQRPGFTF